MLPNYSNKQLQAINRIKKQCDIIDIKNGDNCLIVICQHRFGIDKGNLNVFPNGDVFNQFEDKINALSVANNHDMIEYDNFWLDFTAKTIQVIDRVNGKLLIFNIVRKENKFGYFRCTTESLRAVKRRSANAKLGASRKRSDEARQPAAKECSYSL